MIKHTLKYLYEAYDLKKSTKPRKNFKGGRVIFLAGQNLYPCIGRQVSPIWALVFMMNKKNYAFRKNLNLYKKTLFLYSFSTELHCKARNESSTEKTVSVFSDPVDMTCILSMVFARIKILWIRIQF